MNLTSYLIRCALAFLGRDRDSDQRIAKMLLPTMSFWDVADVPMLEASIRLAELDLPTSPFFHLKQWNRKPQDMLEKIANRRPDLVERLRRLTEERGPAPSA